MGALQEIRTPRHAIRPCSSPSTERKKKKKKRDGSDCANTKLAVRDEQEFAHRRRSLRCRSSSSPPSRNKKQKRSQNEFRDAVPSIPCKAANRKLNAQVKEPRERSLSETGKRKCSQRIFQISDLPSSSESKQALHEESIVGVSAVESDKPFHCIRHCLLENDLPFHGMQHCSAPPSEKKRKSSQHEFQDSRHPSAFQSIQDLQDKGNPENDRPFHSLLHCSPCSSQKRTKGSQHRCQDSLHMSSCVSTKGKKSLHDKTIVESSSVENVKPFNCTQHCVSPSSQKKPKCSQCSFHDSASLSSLCSTLSILEYARNKLTFHENGFTAMRFAMTSPVHDSPTSSKHAVGRKGTDKNGELPQENCTSKDDEHMREKYNEWIKAKENLLVRSRRRKLFQTSKDERGLAKYKRMVNAAEDGISLPVKCQSYVMQQSSAAVSDDQISGSRRLSCNETVNELTLREKYNEWIKAKENLSVRSRRCKLFQTSKDERGLAKYKRMVNAAEDGISLPVKCQSYVMQQSSDDQISGSRRLSCNETVNELILEFETSKLKLANVVRAAFTPLSKKDEKQIDNALKATDRSQVLISHEKSGIDITRGVMQCLLPGVWLNDEVINLYMELLKEREQGNLTGFLRCHFFNTFFYNKVYKDKQCYDFKAVRRWTAPKKLGYSLLDCEKIFVPIHKNIHWCIAIINIRERKFEYLDSLKGRDKIALDVLAKYIVDEAKDKLGKDIDVTNWMHVFPDDIPEQLNGYDCGMFMVKYADFHSRGIQPTFSQEHMGYFRRRMASELLQLKAG